MSGSVKSINVLEVGLTPALNYCASINIEGCVFYNRFYIKAHW